MDGNAIVAAFASTPGPDCLRDVLPKVGQRMKVYMAMKRMMEVYKCIAHASVEFPCTRIITGIEVHMLHYCSLFIFL